jgi:hypothetical protein
MLRKISNRGGLRFHEWKVQMGLPQGDLLTLQESFQAAESTDSRRVLSGLRLQPQIRYPAAQRSSTAKTGVNHRQEPPLHLWWESHLISNSHLGGCGLSMLGAAQSSPTVVAPVGHQALGDFTVSPKATPLDQPRYHRPATQGQKAPTEKTPLRAHQTGHVAQAPHSHQNRLLGCQNPRLTDTDLVSHSGNSEQGEFIHSLNVTDIHTTWVETRAVMGKGQAGVLEAMKQIEQALPFKLLGIDSDNGSEFINYHLKAFCDQKQIQFTRGRPYKKDDNAHIEQKNWTHVRKILGYLRYDSPQALDAINDLYQHELRVLQNLFLPSMKLTEKVRVGSKLKRRYDKPLTPLERLLACPQADPAKLQELKKLRETTDPFKLAKTIEQKLERVYQLANQRVSPSPKILQPTSQPLTRAERQAVLEISELLGINVHIGTPKTNQRRVTS